MKEQREERERKRIEESLTSPSCRTWPNAEGNDQQDKRQETLQQHNIIAVYSLKNCLHEKL